MSRARAWPAALLAAAAVVVAIVVALSLNAQATTPPKAASDPYDAQVVLTSADLAQHLTRQPDLEFGSATAPGVPVITVNAGVRYQRVSGFGAAMTDTSAWLIETQTAAAARQKLMDELFGVGGIHLDFMRVPMGASDFTHDGRPYSYDDMPAGAEDPSLSHFSIAHDRAYILPALRQALAQDPHTELLASPWSPPAWMKANDSLSNEGNLGTLRPAAYRPLAHYFVAFLRDYAAAGVPITAVTPQNEPGSPTLYPGLNLPAGTEASWIAHDLAPALAGAGLHPKVYGGDLGWGPDHDGYMRTDIFGPAGRTLSGISWHCYFGAPGVMSVLRQAAPRLDEIVDECSPGLITPTPTPEIVIGSLRNWASTVALWNLALDPQAGPVQPPNHGCPGCLGLAQIDERTGAISLTRAYYELGQASAFIASGAQRIAATHFVRYVYPHRGVNVVTPGLDDVAVRNPDGSIALVVYDNAPHSVRFAVRWRGRELRYALAPGATATLVWDRT
ncbi:MAG TPA: glycoside hydrolase family 30 beta sandwich domain-containing protein [Solirubrobacteraceae bacterium]|jgi:glucosylceramidase|nr:glycoside hydrolase family 30 beta sandwich domain-containing protein [Solirubrobacteraceae bacterium]